MSNAVKHARGTAWHEGRWVPVTVVGQSEVPGRILTVTDHGFPVTVAPDDITWEA